MTIPDKDGIYSFIAPEEYHADKSSLSSTGARLLLPPSCPAKFRWEMDNKRKPKKEWDFGHVAHKLILGAGEEFKILDPEVHGLKKDGTVSENPTLTAAWKEAAAEARSRGRVPIHIDEHRKAEEMAKAVLDHPVAGPFFRKGAAEVSMYATDPDTGVRLRARADWIPDESFDPNRVWLVDVKTSTTSEPEEFSRKVARFRYDIQAAFYLKVARLLGLDAKADPRFVFVTVEKSEPYLVTVMEYDAPSMNEAERSVKEAIATFARCTEANEWPPYPGTDAVVPISVPAWQFDDEMEMSF